jgi:signal transduction histidine kinase
MLERQESEQVLRIVREGLLNSQRHSQAEIVQLYLKVVQNEITLIIKDNGIGFEPSIPTHDNRDHFGIKIMQARAERLGGKLAIKSAPAAGTEIELCWTTGSILPSQGKA